MKVFDSRPALAVAGLAVLAALAPAEAPARCTIRDTSSLINDGQAADGGVPNYDQADYVDKNDCGPTAAAMLFGYYDANGWPGLVPGTPYQPLSFGVAMLVYQLQDEMPWTSSGGTPPALGIDLNGKAIRRVARDRDPGADWRYDEDETVSISQIKRHIDAERPVLLCVRANLFSEYEWIGSTEDGETGVIAWHWVPIIGYRHRVDGERIAGDCVDWLNLDELWLDLRSGWVRGGDSYLRYHAGFWDDLYTIEVWPDGTPTVADPFDKDRDGFGSEVPPAGYSAADDCDDERADVFPGAPELCDGADNDCDGAIDEGTPDTDADGVRNECDADDDGDGVADDLDNCRLSANPDQRNTDGDAAGDACDRDDDNDGLLDEDDNCPLAPNRDQADLDADGAGDVCDPDDDGDHVADDVDNCPVIANHCQRDFNGDGIGDACQCDFETNPDAYFDGTCPFENLPRQLALPQDECGEPAPLPTRVERAAERMYDAWEIVELKRNRERLEGPPEPPTPPGGDPRP